MSPTVTQLVKNEDSTQGGLGPNDTVHCLIVYSTHTEWLLQTVALESLFGSDLYTLCLSPNIQSFYVHQFHIEIKDALVRAKAISNFKKVWPWTPDTELIRWTQTPLGRNLKSWGGERGTREINGYEFVRLKWAGEVVYHLLWDQSQPYLALKGGVGMFHSPSGFSSIFSLGPCGGFYFRSSFWGEVPSLGFNE